MIGHPVSRDGGNTWTLLTNWLGSLSAYQGGGPGTNYNLPYAHADFHAAAVSLAGKAPRIFFGNDGGIFYSGDAGKSFSDNANQGLVTTLIYSLSVGPVHPDNTLIGLQDNGTLFRVNKGTFTGSIGGDGFGTGWSQANDDISMGSLYYLDIRRWKSNPPNNQAKYDSLPPDLKKVIDDNSGANIVDAAIKTWDTIEIEGEKVMHTKSKNKFVELGAEAHLIRLQMDELLEDVDDDRELVLLDYLPDDKDERLESALIADTMPIDRSGG